MFRKIKFKIAVVLLCSIATSCTDKEIIDDGFYTVQGNGSQLSLIGPENTLIVGNDLTALANSPNLILAEGHDRLENKCYYLLINKNPIDDIRNKQEQICNINEEIVGKWS